MATGAVRALEREKAREGALEERARGASGSMRRCLVTGEVRPREAMIRFVLSPEGEVMVDLRGSLAGRGMWLSAKRDVINTASVKGSFAKAARREVKTPPGLADEVERLLARRCLDLLGLARRAGEAVAGFEKVRALLERGKAVVLLTATDGAPGGRQKAKSGAQGLTLVELFTRAELSSALGREGVTHAALTRGRLAERFLVEAGRLAGFRAPPGNFRRL